MESRSEELVAAGGGRCGGDLSGEARGAEGSLGHLSEGQLSGVVDGSGAETDDAVQDGALTVVADGRRLKPIE